MPGMTWYRIAAAPTILMVLTTAVACGDPKALKDTSIVVPKAGVETHLVASKAEAACQDDCTPVLIIDVQKFPDAVNGLQIEATPSGSAAKDAMIHKHFKSHDGAGSFMVPLDKTSLANGYDLKIKPIYRVQMANDQSSTLVDQIRVEEIRR